jgi:hypothetical protein
VKPAEIDLRTLSSRVRAALELIATRPQDEHTARGVELMAALAPLHADEDVLLAGLLVPLLHAGQLDATAALPVFGDAAVKLATELERVGDSGIPPGWNPGQH